MKWNLGDPLEDFVDDDEMLKILKKKKENK